MKKVLSLMLAIVMLLSVITVSNIESAAIGTYGVNLDSSCYSSSNPFRNYWGQCTWYAWGRALEKTGVALPYRGNAKTWTSGAVNTPRANSVVVWTGGTYGHVAFVEAYDGTNIYITEANRVQGQYSEGVINLSTRRFTYTCGGSGGYTVDLPYGYIYCGSTDTTPPSHDDFKVCEFTDGRFTVYAHVTDPSGIKYVRYAVWSDKNGQDDLVWYTGNHTDGNGYYWIHVYFSEHKNDKGNYIVHMYACDNAGNEKSVGTSYVFPEKGPTISNVKVTDVSASGYTVKCTVKATSEMGIARVQFPTWTTNKGQDDIASNWGTNTAVRGTLSGNTFTFRVNTSEHNYETGYYMTHIYAYDKIGNATSVAIPLTNVHDHKWDTGTVTRKATLTATGVKTYICTVCGDKKTQSIACPKTFTLAKTSYVYTGKTVTPALTVKDTNGKALKKGTDYTVSYASGRKNVGKYAVKVTFKGNYSGTKTLYFTILPKGTAISKLAPAKKAFTVRWNKQAVQTTGYQIQYATNDKFSGAKVKAVKGATKIILSVTNLNGGTTYYVRVRTFKTAGGKNYYSAWSAAKAVKTK